MPRRLHRAPALQVLLLLVIALSLAAPVGRAAAAPGDTGASSTARGIQPPEVTAKSIYVFDMGSGIELYTKDAYEHLQVGSIVKIATALVVMQNAGLDEQVTIAETDLVDTTLYSNMNLTAGDTLTVSQLLYGLLLPSGNDGAKALARYVGGKMSGSTDIATATDTFVKAMNDYAMSLGLENTRFTVPDGIDTPNSYSCAHDMAILAGELMKNEFLRDVVRQPGYRFTSVGPEARVYEKETTNLRLGVSGVVGVKTGTTDEAGGNVILAREVNGGSNIVIMAIIGADHSYEQDIDSRWTDADALMADMDATFTWTTPDNADLMPGLAEQMQVWDLQFQNPPTIPVPTGNGTQIGYQLQVGPPTDAGQQAGEVHLYFGDSEVGAIPIFQGGDQAAGESAYEMAA
jgi:D-alanyl-D-alanine carboxypeptidase (penicillin-binding protein 5/6)